MRLNSDGKLGFSFGVDEEWKPITLALSVANERIVPYIDRISQDHRDGYNIRGAHPGQLRLSLIFLVAAVGFIFI